MVVVVLLMVTCHMLSNTVSVGFECSLLTRQTLQGHIRPINWCKPRIQHQVPWKSGKGGRGTTSKENSAHLLRRSFAVWGWIWRHIWSYLQFRQGRGLKELQQRTHARQQRNALGRQAAAWCSVFMYWGVEIHFIAGKNVFSINFLCRELRIQAVFHKKNSSSTHTLASNKNFDCCPVTQSISKQPGKNEQISLFFFI